jgi:Fur family transcriptional regulator, ferric uptake regulator
MARTTKQRQAVLGALEEASTFCTAQELHDVLRHRGEKVGLATVYRSLQLMADAGEVDVIRGDAGEASYRRCSTQHHHHLVCRSCGRAVEVSGPAVETWADRVAHENGFSGVSHTIELSGLCADCSLRPGDAGSPPGRTSSGP